MNGMGAGGVGGGMGGGGLNPDILRRVLPILMNMYGNRPAAGGAGAGMMRQPGAAPLPSPAAPPQMPQPGQGQGQMPQGLLGGGMGGLPAAMALQRLRQQGGATGSPAAPGAIPPTANVGPGQPGSTYSTISQQLQRPAGGAGIPPGTSGTAPMGYDLGGFRKLLQDPSLGFGGFPYMPPVGG